MAKEIKRIDLKEFREEGYLQEVNRLFFHPLGLALEVIIDDETDEVTLGGVWDYRNDPEGMFFGPDMINPDKINRVECQRLKISYNRGSNPYDIETDDNGIQIK